MPSLPAKKEVFLPKWFSQKTNHNTKISETEKKVSDHNQDKYITTPEFNNLSARIFTVRLAQAHLVKMTDFDTKLQNHSKTITLNKTKHLIVENELKELKNLIHAILELKVIFEKMVHKII